MAELLPFLSLFPEQPSADPLLPPDAEARREALDIRRSFIVEAPAGSGKTGLLIQRYLKLLADESVTSPEQVLAITFTLKATAEMRDRVLAQLEAAQLNPTEPLSSEFDRQTRTLALAVLERDRLLDWSLLDHPHRLNIRTIDSVCAEIARTLPVLSGSGGHLTPNTDAGALHREAARRTILLLGGSDTAFNAALRNLLLHRDGNLANCESLIANMLSLRDQWGDLVPLTRPQLEDAWLDANVLRRLERTLDRVICTALAELEQVFPADVLADLTELAAELGQLDGYNGGPSRIAICAGCSEPPEAVAVHLEHWLALIHLLVTSDGSWRKERGMNRKTLAFDYDRRHHRHPQLAAIIDQLSHRDDLLLVFDNVRELPPARYPANQWAVAKSLFRVLSRALVELQLVFAERNQCDFTELGLLARRALEQDSGADDLAAALGAHLQHLLVDEMQDTSTGQYELIELLTDSWDGHSQTVFLVGDPRQSIYLFRQARVERFIQAMHTGLLGELRLTRLRLTANFRSQRTLVEQFNEDFALVFPQPATPAPEALPYTPAQATRPASPSARGIRWHANPIPPATAPAAVPSLENDDESSEPPTSANVRKQQARRDAREILSIARHWLAKPLPPQRANPWRIAVLARGRAHLTEIVAALRRESPPIYFRAVEIETLSERQEVLDLTALTRALLHPADRVAALAVLRAPCCGLTLADLHTLTGADDPSFKDHSIARLMADRGHLLPDDSCQRMARVWTVLQSASTKRARTTTAQLVERAWRSLGGDSFLNPVQLTNARRFFQLLDALEAETGTLRIDPTILKQRLQSLYAEPDPIPAGVAYVELLTIHKAKGLEWDAVFVPALDRNPGRGGPRLLNWSEIDSPDSSDSPVPAEDRPAHVMLAPIAAKGEDADPLYRWLSRIYRAREAAERKRLFYVACTRAREELHLFAAPEISTRGEIKRNYDSLLDAAWPAAERHFARVTPVVPAQPPVFDLAAAADSLRPILQRLPLSFDPAAHFATAREQRLPYGDPGSDAGPSQGLFLRPEGSFASRSFGNVVHACLEMLSSRMLNGAAPAELLAELPAWTARIAAMLRSDGLPRGTVDQFTRETLAALQRVLRDPDGLWLLAPQSRSASEFAVTAWPSQTASRVSPASIRVDRLFHAGPEPHAPGQDCLWIIDYKTANHRLSGLEDFLNAQRATYGSQLETYARILAPARSLTLEQVRLALYFPTIPRVIWWQASETTAQPLTTDN